jgi:hypothetical protein
MSSCLFWLGAADAAAKRWVGVPEAQPGRDPDPMTHVPATLKRCAGGDASAGWRTADARSNHSGTEKRSWVRPANKRAGSCPWERRSIRACLKVIFIPHGVFTELQGERTRASKGRQNKSDRSRGDRHEHPSGDSWFFPSNPRMWDRMLSGRSRHRPVQCCTRSCRPIFTPCRLR